MIRRFLLPFGRTVLLLSGLISFSLMAQPADSSFLTTDLQSGRLQLTQTGASHFANLALSCIQKEYPNKLSHVMADDSEVKGPRDLHPAFYGCFDWHSSVHGHWMLVRLLKLFPDLPEAADIRKGVDENLQVANIRAEVAYLAQPNRKSFERMYGWAWLLKLAEELHGWEDAQGKKWARNLQPLADAIVARYLDFLPRQTYPIRTGVHPNTAFGLTFAWDYAIATGQKELKSLIEISSLKYYGFDYDCPASWEPGGEDFLSPCLEEAELMARVLSKDAFRDWFGRFLPRLPKELREPASVSDRTDGKIVHLDGLNLSRGWALLKIGNALPPEDPRKTVLLEVANRHIVTTLPNIASGDYAGEHWLASFAIYALSIE
ncbi:MAG: DUF2891 domain-containing protein [Bacteroidota bacterium]